jgi:hypothetical protein
MDALVNQLARELADAIAAAVADDDRIERCRAKAREAGYELRVSLEASVGFASVGDADSVPIAEVPKRAVEMTAGDRRFLKSLRISADETAQREAE